MDKIANLEHKLKQTQLISSNLEQRLDTLEQQEQEEKRKINQFKFLKDLDELEVRGQMRVAFKKGA